MYFICSKFTKKYIKENKQSIKTFRRYINKNPILTLGLLFTVPILPDEVIIIGASVGKIPFKFVLPIVIISKIISVGMIAYSPLMAEYLKIDKLTFLAIVLFIYCLVAIIYKKVNDKK